MVEQQHHHEEGVGGAKRKVRADTFLLLPRLLQGRQRNGWVDSEAQGVVVAPMYDGASLVPSTCMVSFDVL